MKRYHVPVIICLLLLLMGRLSAQDALTDHYNMITLDLASGLPHNNVNQIFPDSKGFLWISTYGGGAVRYDGYSFMKPIFSHSGLSSNSCKAFAEDGYRRLWVAYDEATVVIDLRKMSGTTPTFGKGDISRQLLQASVKVYCDTKGCLWQITRDSIYRYTFTKNGSVDHISSCPYYGNTPDITVCDIESNGSVWINIENGLFRVSETGGKLVRREIAPAMSQLKGLYVTDLLKQGNTIWISTNLGLYAYNQYDSSLAVFRHTSDPHSLSHDHSTSLAITPEGKLLVGTLRGVNILNEKSGTFEHWSTTSKRPLPSDFVHCLLVRDGQIWIGTESAGIVKLSPKPFLIRNFTHESTTLGALSPNPVNAMYVEPDGTLWAGTVEGGLNRRTADGTFIHWTTSNSRLSHNSVSMLTPDTHGRLWIATWGGGLNYIPMATHDQVQHIEMPPGLTALTDYIGALAYDPYNDALWIGSNDGVFYYDLQKGKLEDPFPESRDIRGCIGTHLDKKGHLWMGCLTGVCIIDLRSRKTEGGQFQYRRLRNKLDQPDSPIIDKISCFCETKDGTLWLGSNGYGLYRRIIHPKSGKETFEVLTTDNGLANNSVKGIVEDEQGRLWITTGNGLSIYDTNTNTFYNYGEHDGLLSQCFYWNSAVKGPDGAIYLGSVDGLTEIRGENADARYPIHLSFTRLQVDNQVITVDDSNIIDADISEATCIRLHESNKSMSIDFSALTYAGETQGHYSYRLKGFEDEWTPLNPGEHSVRYTSLKPGTYTFEVKYTCSGEAEEHTISIRVVVTPYFWKSWWFILLMFLALLGLAVWLYKRRVEALRRREAERLFMPIRKALYETDAPEQLQKRIENILDTHEQLQKSYHRSVEADKQESTRNSMTFMERATQVMEQNYMNSDFGIDEFAEAMGMSRSLISKRLNAETGQSTGQFIRNYRLSVAQRLLLENYANRNITEIAYKVGFNDPKYFTRCFTRLYGSSPSTFVGKEGEVDENSGQNA